MAMSTNYALIPAFMSKSKVFKSQEAAVTSWKLKTSVSPALFAWNRPTGRTLFKHGLKNNSNIQKPTSGVSNILDNARHLACWCLENTKPNMQGIAGFCSKIKCTVGSWVNNCDYAKNGNGCSVCPAWYVAMWCDHPTSHIHSQHRDQQQGWE